METGERLQEQVFAELEEQLSRRLRAQFTVITALTARLDWLARARNIGSPHLEEVSSMCYERYLRRRREADESHEMWHDFEQTRPVADPDAPPELTHPERTEAQEEIAITER